MCVCVCVSVSVWVCGCGHAKQFVVSLNIMTQGVYTHMEALILSDTAASQHITCVQPLSQLSCVGT